MSVALLWSYLAWRHIVLEHATRAHARQGLLESKAPLLVNLLFLYSWLFVKAWLWCGQNDPLCIFEFFFWVRLKTWISEDILLVQAARRWPWTSNRSTFKTFWCHREVFSWHNWAQIDHITPTLRVFRWLLVLLEKLEEFCVANLFFQRVYELIEGWQYVSSWSWISCLSFRLFYWNRLTRLTSLGAIDLFLVKEVKSLLDLQLLFWKSLVEAPSKMLRPWSIARIWGKPIFRSYFVHVTLIWATAFFWSSICRLCRLNRLLARLRHLLGHFLGSLLKFSVIRPICSKIVSRNFLILVEFGVLWVVLDNFHFFLKFWRLI